MAERVVSLPFERVANGVRLAVRLTPKAGGNRIDGIAPGPAGPALRVRVTAAPEAGRANAALIKLMAREFGLAKTRISVVRGAASRNKMLHLEGDAGALMARLDEWLGAKQDG